MKLMIASDIHGSACWCRKLLEAWDREGAEHLILLGDILYHGPRNALPEEYAPMEVAAMLNERSGRIFGVRGNCDAEIDQMVLRFPMMADYSLLFSGQHTVFVTHGHLWHADALPQLRSGDVLLHGHTHLPGWEETSDGIFVFNPGSVSIPKKQSAHGYILLEDREWRWKDVSGKEYHRMTLP